MSLFGNSRELNFRTSVTCSRNYLQVQQAKKRNIIEKKEEVGKGCFEGKSKKFRVVIASH